MPLFREDEVEGEREAREQLIVGQRFIAAHDAHSAAGSVDVYGTKLRVDAPDALLPVVLERAFRGEL